ncbi:E3 SUMO-protein ligase MMS21 [Impatiens glandulifera]|uniref:E3 SUMO-protein ligase MMS21 n=1 Tax=Impatiens glandulifera TaxID=253017 RepID=UPI001FB15F2E|nr:E3 SUMO-protein ligase MMS21 [Impatiens glandulifera]
MASTSRHHVGADSFKTAATMMFSENQSLISEIRKTINTMKEVAVDFEKRDQSQMVKVLEDALVELLKASGECTHFSLALQSVGNNYQPGPQLTDFKELFDEEIAKSKANSSTSASEDRLLRQFHQAVWSVHHAGQPMPGEEQEDIVITSTQCNLRNLNCPLSGKPVTELVEPVRSLDCGHIYEKNVILQHIKKSKDKPCAIAGCPKFLHADRFVCDQLLLDEIEEMRIINQESVRPNVIEDITDGCEASDSMSGNYASTSKKQKRK